MSKYKEIKGFKVQTLATDTAASAAAGGAWASAANMNTTAYFRGGAGTQAAGLVWGGTLQPNPFTADTEEFDGTSWSEQNNLPQAISFICGSGTQTAAVSYGGQNPGGVINKVYEYNGTSWSTNPADYPASYSSMAAAGTATASIISGGPPAQTIVNTFDGTNFTEVAELNTGRRGHASTGTTTAAMVVAGETPKTVNTELWNGSAWTEVSNYPIATQDLGAWGTSTDSIAGAGYSTANTGLSAFWNGSAWTEVAEMATARNGVNRGGMGSDSTAGIFAGGDSGSKTNVTEEWSAPANFTQINLGQVYYNSGSNAFKVTGLSGASGTWSSGGALPQVMNQGTGCGVGNTSGMAMTGSSPPGSTVTSTAFQYDGTNWTEVAELNTAKSNASSAKNSPIATTLNYAGDGPGTYSKTNESWNNTSWTEEADLNVAGNAATGFGVSSTSAGRAGGQSTATPPGGPHYTGTEIWNGSSWTEVNELLASRRYAAGVGTVTAALFIGGDTDNGSFPGGRYTARVESWNGTSWSEITDLNAGRANMAGAGIQTSAIAFGGSPPRTGATEFWNGSSWTEISDMAVARQNGTGNGSSASALSVGGESPLSPAVTATVEEWDGVEVNQTITVS